MVGTLQAMGILTLIFILIGAFVVGRLGIVPVLSDVLGARSPKDLGVKYAESDYASGLAKIPGHRIKSPEGACLTCNYNSTGTLAVDNTFTQEEFSAQLNKLNSKNGPARDIQIKFGKNGTMELSCFVKDPRVNAPIYAKGKIDSVSPKKVRVLVEYLEIGRISLPFALAQEPANEAVQEFFRKNPGLSAQGIEVQEGTIRFKGTFPQEILGEP